MTEWEVHTGRL